VRTCLDKLKIDQQIDQQKSNKCSIITILKWDDYQLDDQQLDQQVTSKRPHSKKEKKEKNNNIYCPIDASASNAAGYDADAKALLDFLNKKADRNLRPTKTTLTPIVNRLKEGYTKTEISMVFSYKCDVDDFFTRAENKHLLHPNTLCRASKFPNYLDIAEQYNRGGSDDRD
jgi:uncharacterized phage protein (TIGR02220 family)